MRKQDIEITISPTGQVTFTIKGVKGASCLSETEFLEKALGGDVLDREKTSEFYEQGESSYVNQYGGSGEDSDY